MFLETIGVIQSDRNEKVKKKKEEEEEEKKSTENEALTFAHLHGGSEISGLM